MADELSQEDDEQSEGSPVDVTSIASSSSVSSNIYDHATATPSISGSKRRASPCGWTEEEDNLLAALVEKHNGKNWIKIAEQLPGRTYSQCLHRWQKVIDPKLVKGSWKKEEDDCLIEMVEKIGTTKWADIAKCLPGRTGKQCRERWHNQLQPAIKKDAWTEEEESLLAYYHQIYGNKWVEIAKFLPGRTANAIKNHRNCDLKKRKNNCLVINEGTANLGYEDTETCSTELTLGNTPPMLSLDSTKQPRSVGNGILGDKKTLRDIDKPFLSLAIGYDPENSLAQTNHDSPNNFCSASTSYASTLSYASRLRDSAKGFDTPEIISRRNLGKLSNSPERAHFSAGDYSVERRLEPWFDMEADDDDDDDDGSIL